MRRTHRLSRRGALGAAAGVPLVAACGSDDTGAGTPDPTPASPSKTTASASPTPTSASPPAPPAGLVAAADVPVGGGVVLGEAGVVVTQPSAGTFKGFDTTCTHQGCAVASVTDTINCPCHGSRYALEDAAVVGGPAPRPLAEKPVRVEGGQVRLA